MSIFKYALAGGVAGLGQGMAQVGEAERRAAEQEAERKARMAQVEREAALRRGPGYGGGGGGGGSGGGRGGGGFLPIDVAKAGETELTLRTQGFLPERARDAAMMIEKGLLPQVDREVADESGGHSAKVNKYTDGEASKLANDARIALRRATGAPDKVAEAEGAEQITGYLKEYKEGGNTRAGEAVALGTKGVVHTNDGNVVTGGVAPGSTAEAARKRDLATAGKESALGKKALGEGEQAVKDADITRADAEVTRARSLYERRIQAVEGDATLSPKAKDERITQIRAEMEADPQVISTTKRASDLRTRQDEKRLSSKTESAKSPPASMLREGVVTKFKNGQRWTLRGGKPVQVQ